MNVDVVTFEGLHERLSHTVGLRTAHRGEARHEAEGGGEVERVAGGVDFPLSGGGFVNEP